MAELLLEFLFSSGITILRSSPMYMRQSQEAMLSTQLNAKTIRNAIRKTHQAATPLRRCYYMICNHVLWIKHVPCVLLKMPDSPVDVATENFFAQPIQINTMSSSNMSHVWRSSFDRHFYHSIIILENESLYSSGDFGHRGKHMV